MQPHVVMLRDNAALLSRFVSTNMLDNACALHAVLGINQPQLDVPSVRYNRYTSNTKLHVV